MNTRNSTSVKFKRMLVNILSIFVILAMAFPVTSGVSAASDSPFAGHWEAIDVDKSDIRLSIGGPSSGPFQITWTESKDDSGLGFCEGGPGIIRGTGLLNEDDLFALEADLLVECFTFEKSLEFHLTFRYIPSTDTLVTTYPGGLMAVFTHPRSPQAAPAQVRLMTNYQEDWASGFYEEGHTVWLAVTESDGISVKATAEMVTGPQPGWDGGEIGFASQPSEWQPGQPDIVPNDWVYAWVDNGASAQMQVGEISAWVDLENDQVLGTVSAGWYGQEVYIYCFLWGGTDARDDMIMADGSEEFNCSWSGGAYDIQPGDVAEVQYYGPDGHAVDYYLFIPNPHFTVFPEWEWFDGYDWPDGETVDITVEGKSGCDAEGVSSGNFFNGGFPEGCDIAVNDVVTFTDGVTTRTHTVQNLAITDVDKEANTVTGTADVGALVYAWVHEYGYDMELQIVDGTWLADFGSAGLDLVENMGGRAEIRDEFGNSTAVDWWIPNPIIIAHPDQEWVEGWNFQDGAEVELTIYDGVGSLLYQDVAVAAPPDWDPGNPNAFVRFNVGYDMKAGDHLWMTDGASTKDMIVTALMPTGIDPGGQIVYGIADPNSEVTLEHQGEMWTVTADPNGSWSASLPTLARGSDVLASQWDDNGDMTRIAFHIPNTRFTVFPEWNYLEGYEWPDGAVISIDVTDKDVCATQATSGFPEWDPSNTFFSLNFPDGCDIVASDLITLSSEWFTLTHQVGQLAVTEVDLDLDTVSGTAVFNPEQYLLHTWIHGVDGSYMQLSAEGGNWIADFGFELQPGMAGRVELVDQSSNATAVEWWVPTTFVVTSTVDVLDNDGYCTLREAIIAANTNAPSGDMNGECPAGVDNQTDTILLAADQTYSLTIDSTCGDDQVCGDLDIWDNSAATDLVMIVDGNGSVTISQDATVDDRVLENHGAGVEIEGLTLTGGTAGWSGGGIFNTGTMLVSHSTITANSSPIDGGGGIANEGSMTLIGSTVSNNTSIHDGGGIANTGSLTLDAGELFGNSGAGGGALANLPGGHATIQNGTQVHNNSAGTGALFNYGTLNVIDSAVFNNIAEYGGGLSNWGGMLTVSNSSVSENSATASAGGIHNKDGGTTFIENGSIISGNTAAWDGGGINNWDGTVTITGSTVSGNSAVQSGGGILNLVAGTVSIDGSILANNTANSTEYSSGGALANWGGTITIANSSVAGNASNWGGGLATHGGTLTLDASTLSGNIATTEGGGIFTNDLGSVLIQNGSLVTANTAGWGGGVSSWDSTLTVDASTVSGNTAQSFGGGILNKEGGGTTVQNGSVISANMAMGGGGVHNEWGSLTIKDSTISENTVTGYGGGIQNSWYGVLTIDDSLIARNMASMGAGIYNLPRTSTSITGSVLSENSASNSGGGIVVESSGYLTMTGSALLSNTSPGDGDAIRMNVYIPNEVKVNASCIVGNGDVAVDNSALYDFQDFSGNWWGDASGPNGAGPGTGDSVSDLVDFSGWLNEPLAICAPE